MCGIVGMINREGILYHSEKMIKFFNQALYSDAVRGKHGTGVFTVNPSGSVETYKKALCAADFLELETTKKIIGNNNAVFMVGHNRFATQGAHTSENSHPFNHEHIHMVHNGTLDFYKSLTPGKNFVVDSDAIAYLLSESTAKEALEKLEGAYSLVWYDELEETLNFARNKERPMFIATIDKSDSMLFGSESGMIEWIADRVGITIDKVYQLPVGKHLAIPLEVGKRKTTYSDFTPKKAFDYYYSYPRGKVTNIHHHTPAKKKYTYLEGLEYVDVVADTWTPYNTQASTPDSYGKLDGVYNHDLSIETNSIQRKDMPDLLGKSIRVKILTVQSDTKATAKFLGLTDELKAKEEAEAAEKKSEIEKLNSIVSYEELTDLPVLFRGSHHPSPILNSELADRIKHGCTNCGDVILADDVDDIMWSKSGEPYCADCTLSYIQTI